MQIPRTVHDTHHQGVIFSSRSVATCQLKQDHGTVMCPHSFLNDSILSDNKSGLF